jgi:RimJ/RimL family protein N-acetyltransferase
MGQQFINMVLDKGLPSTDFAIEVDEKAVGGIGIVLNSDVERISAEIGYWLGEMLLEQRNHDKCCEEMVDYAFSHFPIKNVVCSHFRFQ